jgi:GNAT superfamily N-acetyltransferase
MHTTSATLAAAVTESLEAEFMYRCESNTPEPARTVLGLATTRIADGVAMSMRNDPSGYWSKALGFGTREPVSAELIDRVLDFYRAQDSPRAAIQIAPSARPENWESIAATRNLRPGTTLLKLACPIDQARPAGATNLRVGPVGEDDAQEWAAVIIGTFFGQPYKGLTDMYTALASHPDFQAFAVWDGSDIVAGASLFIDGELGHLNSGATLAGHRGHGAQSALIAARAEAAREAGCRWLVTEVAKPSTEGSNPSLNNMLRAGLHVLYERQNVIWEGDNAGDVVAA